METKKLQVDDPNTRGRVVKQIDWQGRGKRQNTYSQGMMRHWYEGSGEMGPRDVKKKVKWEVTKRENGIQENKEKVHEKTTKTKKNL